MSSLREDRGSSRCLVTVLLLLATSSTTMSDNSRTPGAKGHYVVEQVCRQLERTCAFKDDKLFTRRLAYVETLDGKETLDEEKTGYHGGIWKVDKRMFDETKTAKTEISRNLTRAIEEDFDIVWPSVEWSDLKKPLYSAIAARFYIGLQLKEENIDKIPRDISGQAGFWKEFYRNDGDEDHFEKRAKSLEHSCKNIWADIVFVLDGSESVSVSQWKQIQEFTKDVIGAFDVGWNEARFGVVQFGLNTSREIDLNSYFDKNYLQAAVGNIERQRGGTPTHLGLKIMTQESFTTRYGARDPSKYSRVGIVLTDGISDFRASTLEAAIAAQNAGITLIAVGINGSTDGLDLEELDAIATEPACLHRILLDSFSEVETLKDIIIRRICGGVLTTPAPTTTTTTTTTTPRPTTTTTTTTKRPTTPYNPCIPNPCRSGECRPTDCGYECNTEKCGDDDCYTCERNNPCTRANIEAGNFYFPHCHRSYFIQCSETVKECHKMPCPSGLVWSQKVKNCIRGPDTPDDTNPPAATTKATTTKAATTKAATTKATTPREPDYGYYDCGRNNPCTEENVAAEKFYFRHKDPKQFVQCDEWGQCFVRPCAPGTEWDPVAYTCNWPKKLKKVLYDYWE